MKNSRNQSNKQSKQGLSRVPKPEIRDDLDSRKNEEQDLKGSDITHNKKETKSSEDEIPAKPYFGCETYFFSALAQMEYPFSFKCNPSAMKMSCITVPSLSNIGVQTSANRTLRFLDVQFFSCLLKASYFSFSAHRLKTGFRGDKNYLRIGKVFFYAGKECYRLKRLSAQRFFQG